MYTRALAVIVSLALLHLDFSFADESKESAAGSGATSLIFDFLEALMVWPPKIGHSGMVVERLNNRADDHEEEIQH